MRLIIKHIIFIGILGQSYSMASQSYWSNRYDFDSGNDRGSDIQFFQHDKLIIPINGFCELNTRSCTGFIIISTSGELVRRVVIYDSLDANYSESIFIRDDTIFYNTNYIGVDSLNYSLLQFDTGGIEIFRHDYFHPGTQGLHYARKVTGNDSLLFVNFAYKDGDLPAREVIRAYDRSWNIVWETSVPNTFPHIRWCSTQPTYDGGLVAAYTSRQNGEDYRKATVEKYSANGDMEWQTPLPYTGDFRSDWIKIDNHPDGGYVGMWEYDTFAFDITIVPTLLFKLDENGDIEWERLDLDNQVNLNDIFSAQNGDIIGCGVAEDSYWDNDDGDYEVAYVIRLNSAGEKKWERKIAEESEGTYIYELNSGDESLNGDLFFTGSIIDTIFGTPEDPTPGNIWVLKLDSLGCLSPDCGEWQHITTAIDEMTIENQTKFGVFPNPATDHLIIGAQIGDRVVKGGYRVAIFDLAGRLLSSQSFNPLYISQLDVSDLLCGTYIVTVWRDGLLVQSEKVEIY